MTRTQRKQNPCLLPVEMENGAATSESILKAHPTVKHRVAMWAGSDGYALRRKETYVHTKACMRYPWPCDSQEPVCRYPQPCTSRWPKSGKAPSAIRWVPKELSFHMKGDYPPIKRKCQHFLHRGKPRRHSIKKETRSKGQRPHDSIYRKCLEKVNQGQPGQKWAVL